MNISFYSQHLIRGFVNQGSHFLQFPWVDVCVSGDTKKGQTVSSSSDVNKLLSPI